MKLLPFQRRDFAAAALLDGVILSLEQGLGKSFAAFTIPFIWRSPRVLLVAPGDLHSQLAATAAKDALSVAVTLASATTTNLATALGDYVTITGTTTITGFGTAAAGVRRLVRFSGVLHLTQNSTSMILLGGADITTAANDMAMFVSEGAGNWRMAFYSRAANTP